MTTHDDRCPKCGHAPHEGDICLNLASDNECGSRCDLRPTTHDDQREVLRERLHDEYRALLRSGVSMDEVTWTDFLVGKIAATLPRTVSTVSTVEVTVEMVERGARAISPNEARWGDFTKTARRVLEAALHGPTGGE